MRLLSPDCFAAVFEPLVNQRVGYIRPFGNVGDRLIETATFQLLDEFGIRWSLQDPDSPPGDAIDHLVFGGGGNMGTLYPDNWNLRRRVVRYGFPMTILPQSFATADENDYAKVFVRERGSLAFCPSATLAPDLALGLNWTPPGAATKGLGVFLRRDCESVWGRRWWNRDPAKMCRTPTEYLNLAARYRKLITDRLHFAICGLIAGCEVVILPNSYHKNRSMHESSLAALGCKFASTVREARASLKNAYSGWQLATFVRQRLGVQLLRKSL